MKMSGLNGSGEMSLGNLKVEIAESNIATLFAQDIVNEVLQKALSIVAQVHESKLTWESFGENKAYNRLIGEYVKKGIELCDVRVAEVTLETHPLEMETAKAETDVELVSSKELPGGGGVGDQPIIPKQESEVEVFDQPAPQECTTTPVEKKSRVADLVKSSKQVLSAYILDEKTKQIRDALEEEQEQFLQVFELEATKAAQFKAYKKIQPEAVPLPNDDADIEEDFQRLPEVTDAMDTIDLSTTATDQEKSEIESEKEMKGGNTTFKPLDVIPEIVRDGPSEPNQDTDESNKDKKKKWNLGSRIMQFIRRPRQKARGTQTVTRK